MIWLKLILWQRFQSLKSYISSELRSILTVYSEETEQVVDEIDSLASYVKDFNVIIRSALIAKIAKDEQDVDAHAELAAVIADNFSHSY